MKIALVTPTVPALSGTVTGNDVTARRWEEILKKLAHDVIVLGEYGGEEVDVLVALHAVKSAPSIEKFSKLYPNRPLLVALTGTDLYNLDRDGSEVHHAPALRLATHVIVLQPGALDVLEPDVRVRTTVIYQSAKPIAPPLEKAANCFQACLIAHLRSVKDPLLAAEASAKLSDQSVVQVVHAGAALEDGMQARAEAAAAENPRYRWIGPIPHEEALLLIARSHLLLLTSRSEGGANVLSEALALGVPILATRVPGVVGLLGERYPGLYPAGDADRLAELLDRAERDEIFHRRLERACEKLAPMVAPSWELRSWQQLLSALT